MRTVARSHYERSCSNVTDVYMRTLRYGYVSYDMRSGYVACTVMDHGARLSHVYMFGLTFRNIAERKSAAKTTGAGVGYCGSVEVGAAGEVSIGNCGRAGHCACGPGERTSHVHYAKT